MQLRRGLLPIVAVLSTSVAILASPTSAYADVFINEIHYDDAGADADEGVEVVATAGEDLSLYAIETYNGSSGAQYGSSTAVPVGSNVACTLGGSATIASVPVAGLQNGGPDGIALIGPGSSVVQFLSYEGSFAATDGNANGQVSIDIGVSEQPAPADGTSLQLNGSGSAYADFTWSSSATSTFGDCNTTQSFTGSADIPPSVSGTTPANTAINVALNTNVDITFDETVTATDATAFSLECPVATPIAFTVTTPAVITDPVTTYTLDPDADLPASTVCTVTVDASKIADTDGTANNMAANYGFSFTTLTPPTNPVVSFVSVSEQGLEGDVGTSNIVFTLDISPAPGNVSFDATATAGSTNPTDASDFDPAANFGNPVSYNFTAASTPPYQISIPVSGDTVFEADETFTLTLNNFSGTDIAQTSPISATGTIQNDDRIPIPQVQGSGPCSPLVVPCSVTTNTPLAAVAIAASVVTAVGPDGFAMQDAVGDGDLATSDGVWVFTFDPPVADDNSPIAVGDQVEVTGGVKEYYGLTEVQVNSTRDAGNSIVRTGSNQAMPTAVEFSTVSGIPSTDPTALSCPGSGPNALDPLNADTNFECFEGMLVNIVDGLTISGNQGFGGDLYEELEINPLGARAYREKGVKLTETPVAGAYSGTWDGNPETLELDAERLGTFATDFEIVGGVSFAGQGVINFERGDYEFWPVGEYPVATPRFSLTAAENLLPRPVSDPALGDPGNELRVGSFNTWRLCDIINDIGQPGGGPNGYTIQFDCDATGIETGGQAAYDLKLQKISAYIRTVLRSPDVLGLQEAEKLTVLQDLATQIASDGGPSYTAYLIEGNDPGGIDVGFLVNQARISNVSVQQQNGTAMWDDPSSGTDALHDRPPLLLTAEFSASAGGRAYPFAVLNVHNRSFGSTNRVYAKRFMQAKDIAGIVQAYQTNAANSGQPLVVLGDFNAYQFSDGHTDPVGLISGTYDNTENECSPTNAVTDCNLPESTPGVTDQVVTPALVKHTAVLAMLDPNEVYSYTFSENFGTIWGYQTAPGGDPGRRPATNQVIDHLLMTTPASNLLAEFQYGRANVDASWNGHQTATAPDGAGGTHSDIAIGSSDHDGFVATFSLDCSSNAAADGDSDTVCDVVDNCPAVANATQTDANGNGFGAACDAAPVAVNDPASGSYLTNEDTVFSIPAAGVLANDTDTEGDGLQAGNLDASAANGSVNLASTGGFDYTPNPNFCDDDTPVSFTYVATDGESASAAAATVSITVACVNDAPVITSFPSPTDVNEGAVFSYTPSATDVDSAVLTWSVLAGDTCGGSFSGGTYSFTAPTGNPAPLCNMGIQVCDDAPSPACDTQNEPISINLVDDPAALADDTASVDEDSAANAIDVLANDVDVDSALSITAVTQGANGSVVITGGGTGLTYAPNANFCSATADSFTYTANGQTATVNITVNCLNDDALAVADSATVAQGSFGNAIDVAANDTADPDFAATLDSIDPVSANGGTISIVSNQASYTPAAGFCGVDSFSYTLVGGSSATVSVSVTCSAPAIFADGFE